MQKRLAIFRTSSSPLNVETYNIQEIGFSKALFKIGYSIHFFSVFENLDSSVVIKKNEYNEIVLYPLVGKVIKKDLIFSFKKNNISLNKYNLIQVQEYSSLMTSFILQKAVKNGVKTIINQGMYNNYSGLKYFFQWIYDKLFLKKIIQNTNIFFAKTEYAATYLNSKDLKTVYHLPVGIDLVKFEKEEVKINEISEFSQRYSKIALYIGKIEKRRSPEFLIKLMKLFSDDIGFIIVGNGELAKRFDRLLKKDKITNCYWLKKINQDKIKTIYKSADVLLLPTKHEIYGMVILEALYFGLPVLSTPTAGPLSIINGNSDLGINVDLSVKKWKEALLSLLNNDNRNKQFKRKKYIIDNFSWEKIAKNYDAVVKKLMLN